MPPNPADVAAPRLKLRVFTKDDATVVECSGRLAADVAATLRNEVKSLIPDTKRIVLDLVPSLAWTVRR